LQHGLLFDFVSSVQNLMIPSKERHIVERFVVSIVGVVFHELTYGLLHISGKIIMLELEQVLHGTVTALNLPYICDATKMINDQHSTMSLPLFPGVDSPSPHPIVRPP
jgi:hypothetical protein